jgi:hypothetical protein
MNPNVKISRMAGFWYLLVAVFGALNSILVDPKLTSHGDPAVTIQAILSSQALFRFGILSDFLCVISFLLLANTLYKLFEPVDKDLVRLLVIFVISSVPFAFLQMFKIAPLLLMSSNTYAAFEPDQLRALSLAFLALYHQGVSVTYIFYGLWMFPLGMLVFKARPGFISKALGILLIAGCFGYLGKSLENFLALNISAITSAWMILTILAEIACILWLFLQGPVQWNFVPNTRSTDARVA